MKEEGRVHGWEEREEIEGRKGRGRQWKGKGEGGKILS
jgi:hypothetical protein